MVKIKLFFYVSLLLLILLFPANAIAGQTLDESNNGDVVVVVEGQSLELSLDSNPSTYHQHYRRALLFAHFQINKDSYY